MFMLHNTSSCCSTRSHIIDRLFIIEEKHIKQKKTWTLSELECFKECLLLNWNFKTFKNLIE